MFISLFNVYEKILNIFSLSQSVIQKTLKFPLTIKIVILSNHSQTEQICFKNLKLSVNLKKKWQHISFYF